jgi:hypothetical protein
MTVTKREAAHGVDRVTRFQGENATMHSPILPVGGPSGPPIAGPGASVVSDVDDLVAGLNAGTLSIAAARVGPPTEVLEQMAAASAIEQRLRSAGQRLRFSAPAPGGRTTVELHDCDGLTMRTLSITEAFSLACGGLLV